MGLRRLVVVSSLVILAFTLLKASSASASVQGQCQASFGGQSVNAGHDTPRSALRIPFDKETAAEGTAGTPESPGVVTAIHYTVELAGTVVRLPVNEQISADQASWASTVPIGNFSWASIGLGLVRMEADTSNGRCTAAFFVCITGKSPVATLIGGVSLAFALFGLALVVHLLVRLRRLTPRRTATQSFVGEALAVAAVGVILQQACVAPLDLFSVAIVPVLIAVFGTAVALAAKTFVRRGLTVK